MKNSPLLFILFSALCAAEPSWETTRVYGLGSVYSLSYSPDGSKLVTSGVAGAQLWDVAPWTVERQFLGHQGAVRSASWSPDQSQIATAGDDNTIKIWDASTGVLMNTLTGHTDNVYTIAWSPDGVTIASGSADH